MEFTWALPGVNKPDCFDRTAAMLVSLNRQAQLRSSNQGDLDVGYTMSGRQAVPNVMGLTIHQKKKKAQALLWSFFLF